VDEKAERVKELERELRLLKLVNQRQRSAIKHLIKALTAQGGYG
jgi:hypothetical protein